MPHPIGPGQLVSNGALPGHGVTEPDLASKGEACAVPVLIALAISSTASVMSFSSSPAAREHCRSGRPPRAGQPTPAHAPRCYGPVAQRRGALASSDWSSRTAPRR